ncbi:hypothetical protein [Microbacterium elymi]|uniref:Uncharacterized protein n=1 Tax=Microbacterium elymi TaxID=2909587 RepID=A0ABY5NH78_9MICO|nr:hypothetical protein [Microbacterium elymi]UUT34493.1 hypothetical protein L2X98_28490 [Microbacterium elymi]
MVAAIGVTFYRGGGSFYTKTTITFTLPTRSTLIPGSGTDDSSVIAFASAVATEINRGKPVPTYSSADAPYYGAGVRQGVMVSLRNAGNQWMASFPTATIDIQIVGATRDWVAGMQQSILDNILGVARAQQSASLTAPSDRITASVEPLTTQIIEISSSRSTQLLAAAALALAGLIAGGWAAIAVDRAVRRPRIGHRGRRGSTTSDPAPRMGDLRT